MKETLPTLRPIDDRTKLGAVYTPDDLAEWAASLISEISSTRVKTILDPACGDGALLAAARRGMGKATTIVGLDISKRAINSAKRNLGERKTELRQLNTLLARKTDLPHVDAVVMNPPWGADLSLQVEKLKRRGYSLAVGQFDSWDLFVEWSLIALSEGTVVVAILPDSIFLPEHARTRRMILGQSQLRVIARLGEGWFDSVFRGVAVLAYEVGGQTTEPVQIIRLDQSARKRVMSGISSLAMESSNSRHFVSPSRWLLDPMATFRATTSSFVQPWTESVESQGGEWTKWFQVGRGVEVGAEGTLFRCKKCGWHRGPSKSLTNCKNCRQKTVWTEVHAITSVQKAGAVPLIVGRDVRRYSVRSSRWLATGLHGVAYKDEDTYASPKLLVRKTGLGINAAVDNSGSYTNQVVFHYVLHEGLPSWILYYTQGVLCSKVMLAVHLANSGETEWRSHPYVTPRVLSSLPIPVPLEGTKMFDQAFAIAAAAREVHIAPDTERGKREQYVDGLVAGLFGLDELGCARIDKALSETQDLEAFSHIRSVGSVLRSVVA
jgi:adenine-specific DNA-methyltransferase